MKFGIAALAGIFLAGQATATGLQLDVTSCKLEKESLGCPCKGGSGNYNWRFLDLPEGWKAKNDKIIPQRGNFEDRKVYGAKVEVQDAQTRQSVKKALFFTFNKGKIDRVVDDQYQFDADEYLNKVKREKQGKKEDFRFKNFKKIINEADGIGGGVGLTKLRPFFNGNGKFEDGKLKNFVPVVKIKENKGVDELVHKKRDAEDDEWGYGQNKERREDRLERQSEKREDQQERREDRLERQSEKADQKDDEKDQVDFDKQDQFDDYTQRVFGKGFRGLKKFNNIRDTNNYQNRKVRVKRCNIFSQRWTQRHGNPWDKDNDGVNDKVQARRRFDQKDFKCNGEQKFVGAFKGRVKFVNKNVIRVVLDRNQQCDVILGGCTHVEAVNKQAPEVGDSIFWKGEQKQNNDKFEKKQFNAHHVTCF